MYVAQILDHCIRIDSLLSKFQRPFISDQNVPWSTPWPDYTPIEFTSEKILKGTAYSVSVNHQNFTIYSLIIVIIYRIQMIQSLLPLIHKLNKKNLT